MDLTIHATFLPQDDPDAALAFYRDTSSASRSATTWATAGCAGSRSGRSASFRHVHRPAPAGADLGITDDERRTITEMMAKGTYASLMLSTKDLDGAFARLQAGAEAVQEPTEQLWGARDFAVRDPAGNLIRIQQAPRSRRRPRETR